MKRAIVGIATVVLVVASTVGAAAVYDSVRTQAPAGRFARHEVKVFFTRQASTDSTCDRVRSFGRVSRGSDVLHDAMSELVSGPTRRERRSGVTSMFSKKTAGMVNAVAVSNGVARIDLDDMRRIIPSASSSCGSASLLAELKATAKQFSSVERAIFSFEGSRNAFYAWLQRDVPK